MKVLKKFGVFFIESNLFIAFAASLFTLETQLLLGMELSFHPYLFIIFFATFFDYNLHRLYTLKYSKSGILNEKYAWLNRNKQLFYILMVLASLGFICCLFLANVKVLFVMLPFAISTIMYSIPLFPYHGRFIRLRDVAYAKVFIIAFNWTFITFLLPYVKSDINITSIEFFVVNGIRFLWILALCLPFDIRDIDSDASYGLKTIPNQIGATKALRLANAFNLISGFIALIYFGSSCRWGFAVGFLVASLITHLALNLQALKPYRYYYWGILDGCLIVHFLCIWIMHYLL